MIIIEGPDNSGKSTLASNIGLPYKHPGPAPINEFELNMCLHNQHESMNEAIIYDRVSCISHQVYNEGWFNHPLLRQYLNSLIENKKVLFIYCRPPESHLMNFAHHKAKDYDTEEHIKKIIDNQSIYINRYDELFSSIPHIAYDFTDADMFKARFIESIVKFAYGENDQIRQYLIGNVK